MTGPTFRDGGRPGGRLRRVSPCTGSGDLKHVAGGLTESPSRSPPKNAQACRQGTRGGCRSSSGSASACFTASRSSLAAVRCSAAGRSRWRAMRPYAARTAGQPRLATRCPVRREDEEVRSPVGRVGHPAQVTALDEPADVVADRGRRKTGLGSERAGGHGLEGRYPAEEREQLLRHPRPGELPVDEQPDQEPGGVELLQEVGFPFPGIHAPNPTSGHDASSSLN